MIAFGIVIGAGLHVVAHLTCDFPRLLHATDAEYEPMKPFFGDTRPNNYWWFVKGTEGWTGVVMLVLMVIAYILAQPWFRRNRLNLPKPLKKLTGFNAFWYSHHLFVIVYILLVIHGYFLYLSRQWYNKTVSNTQQCGGGAPFRKSLHCPHSSDFLLGIGTDMDVSCLSHVAVCVGALAAGIQVGLQDSSDLEGISLSLHKLHLENDSLVGLQRDLTDAACTCLDFSRSGCSVSRERDGPSHVEASRIQIHKRAIRLC